MRWGFEAEYGLVDGAGELVDFVHPRWAELQGIVDNLPDHADADLTRGDLAIKWSRWYVEGDERFDEDGRFLRCVPKGIEVRTPTAQGIAQALETLARLTDQLAACAFRAGLRLTALGHNPVHSRYAPEPGFNAWELAMRAEHPEYDAPEVYMCTYGPDVNLSDPAWTARQSYEAAGRLAAWAPEIVAFSLNAPIVDGAPYGGLSYRTQVRAGRRPSVRLFLPPPLGDHATAGDHALTGDHATADDHATVAGLAIRSARIPTEAGRIEFKALDAFADLGRFAAYAALIGGVARAAGLPAPRDVQEGIVVDPAERLRAAARTGFGDDALTARCAILLDLARDAWDGAHEAALIAPLRDDLAMARVPALDLLRAHAETGAPPLPHVVLPG